jgi:hypothetical protein
LQRRGRDKKKEREGEERGGRARRKKEGKT